MPRDYYFNPEFDLELSGDKILAENVQSYIEELRHQFLFAGTQKDTVVLDKPLPHSFMSYLWKQGWKLPRLTIGFGLNPNNEFTPYGWSLEAREAAHRYHMPPRQLPDSEIIKTVNSKRYSLDLAKKFEPKTATGIFIENENELNEILQKNPKKEWLLKWNHGHSGIGHFRLRSGEKLSQGWINKWKQKAEPVLMEPWFNRIQDIGTYFELDRKGSVSNIRTYELINSADGAYIGVLISPKNIEPAREKIFDSVSFVGGQLFNTGYHGPVNIDSFYYEDEYKKRKFRSIVEINARYSMSYPAFQIKNLFENEKYLLWRFYNGKKLSLTGDSDFDYERVTKIRDNNGKAFLTSPFWVGKNEEKLAQKISVAFVGDSKEELGTLQEKFSLEFINSF